MVNRFFIGWFAVSMVMLGAMCVSGWRTPSAVNGETLTTDVDRRGSIPESQSNLVYSPYVGPEPPGRTSEPFAPDLFTRLERPLHGAVAFSPGGERMCWSVLSSVVVYVRCAEGFRSEPEILPAPGKAVQASSISPDGGVLFFLSQGRIWWVDAGILPRGGAG